MTPAPSFPRRIAIGAGVAIVVSIGYRSLQILTLDRAEFRSECWTWHWLPFSAGWIIPYDSMFALVGLPWLLLPTHRDVWRYTLCVLFCEAVAWGIFLLHPTACVRPLGEGQAFLYRVMLAVDFPDNCLPCLHSALSVVAATMLSMHVPFLRTPLATLGFGLWVALVCISIVALRQHTGVDMICGVGLGAVVVWLLGQNEFTRRLSHADMVAGASKRNS